MDYRHRLLQHRGIGEGYWTRARQQQQVVAYSHGLYGSNTKHYASHFLGPSRYAPLTAVAESTDCNRDLHAHDCPMVPDHRSYLFARASRCNWKASWLRSHRQVVRHEQADRCLVCEHGLQNRNWARTRRNRMAAG